jgi:hypothetical protein
VTEGGGTDPVLLVGAQRSGTTALGVRLSEAIRDAGGLFTVNGKLMYYLKRWCHEPEHRHLRADEIIHGLQRREPLGTGVEAWQNRTEAVLREDAHACAATTDGDPVERVRRLCRTAYGVPLWGDKYNEYLLDLEFLHTLFPNATWIFLARHPGEVVRSLLEWRGDRPWNPTTAAAAALKWDAWNSEWLRFRERLAPGQRIELLYEDLAAGRRGALDDRLGIDLGPYMAGFRNCFRPRISPLPDEALRTWDSLCLVCAPS